MSALLKNYAFTLQNAAYKLEDSLTGRPQPWKVTALSSFFDKVSTRERNTEGGFTMIFQALSSHSLEVIGLSIKILQGIREGSVQTKLRIDISVIAREFTSLAATIFEACPDKDPAEVVRLAYKRAEAIVACIVPRRKQSCGCHPWIPFSAYLESGTAKCSGGVRFGIFCLAEQNWNKHDDIKERRSA
ncbi:hypothetical protein BJX99DRAFT_264735 [Aspergillus californicus]